MKMKPKIVPTSTMNASHHHATTNSDIAITISVGAGRSAPKLENTCLERRDDPHHDDPDDDDGDGDDRDRVEQRRLDLGLDGEHLFLVGREAIEDRVEHAGGLAGGHQVAVERVEILGMLAKRLRHRRTGLDLVLDVHHETRKARIAVAARDDLERLQQRHAGLQHRRQLAREERDVLLADTLAAAERLALDLDDAHALAPQVGGDDGFGGGPRLPAHLAVVAVDALPEVAVFLDVAALGGCGCHDCPRVPGFPVTRW